MSGIRDEGIDHAIDSLQARVATLEREYAETLERAIAELPARLIGPGRARLLHRQLEHELAEQRNTRQTKE
jgi:hypothetical protein